MRQRFGVDVFPSWRNEIDGERSVEGDLWHKQSITTHNGMGMKDRGAEGRAAMSEGRGERLPTLWAAGRGNGFGLGGDRAIAGGTGGDLLSWLVQPQRTGW